MIWLTLKNVTSNINSTLRVKCRTLLSFTAAVNWRKEKMKKIEEKNKIREIEKKNEKERIGKKLDEE